MSKNCAKTLLTYLTQADMLMSVQMPPQWAATIVEVDEQEPFQADAVPKLIKCRLQGQGCSQVISGCMQMAGVQADPQTPLPGRQAFQDGTQIGKGATHAVLCAGAVLQKQDCVAV